MNQTTDKYVDVVEESAAYRLLQNDARGAIGHAYLLVSPDTLALDILADLFLAAVIGGADAYRRVKSGIVPDVIRLPEEGDKVVVKDVDYLTETAYLTPAVGDKKFYVISYGESMNEAAQNKLLKTLEEPPTVTHIIIKTASADAMLPTVRSRCRVVELKAFANERIEAAMKKYYPDSPQLSLAAATCRGELTRAERTVSDRGYTERYDQTVDMLRNMRRSSEIARFAGRIVADKEGIRDVLDDLELVLRDCLTVHAGRPELAVYRAGLNDTRAIAADFSVAAVLGILPLLTKARQRLKYNGNAAGVVDELLFNLLEVKAKCRK